MDIAVLCDDCGGGFHDPGEEGYLLSGTTLLFQMRQGGGDVDFQKTREVVFSKGDPSQVNGGIARFGVVDDLKFGFFHNSFGRNLPTFLL